MTRRTTTETAPRSQEKQQKICSLKRKWEMLLESQATGCNPVTKIPPCNAWDLDIVVRR